MKLFECIYGFFDPLDCNFVEGSFQIKIKNKPYNLVSREVVKLDQHVFEQFDELTEYYHEFNEKIKESRDSIPSERYIVVTNNYYKKHLTELSIQNPYLEKKIRYLIKRRYCLEIRIDHQCEGDPFEYINNVRDIDGIKVVKGIFLSIVREFNNYHILIKAPHIYLADIHFRSTDGIFSYFCSEEGRCITKVRPIMSWWTPKLEGDAEEKAREFFKKGEPAPIEDMLMARALVYAEQQQLSLAIIHAVMTLEVLVPEFINTYLKTKGVSKSTIDDFNRKFGLSVRVKAMLKVILPKNNHSTIDLAGQAVKCRNDILHTGLSDLSLSSAKVKELVHACELLMGVIKEYSKAGFSNKRVEN